MIKVNISKARLIAHDMRRYKRSLDFSPFDEVIAKQIPGADAIAAEAARQEIRKKYEAIQQQIDEAHDIETLAKIVNTLETQQ